MFSIKLWSVAFLVPSLASALPFHRIQERSQVVRGFELPITRRSSGLQRRAFTGEAELGDLADFQYTVSLELGKTTTNVHLDTGSSDLWVITDQCTKGTCATTNATKYTSSPTFNSTGGSVTLQYGDSTTGTSASGPIGKDTASLAGISIPQQAFAAVNFTDNAIVSSASNAAGIFGLAFPSESLVQAATVNAEFGNPQTTDAFVSSTAENGPLLSRLAMTGAIDQPMFTITLQRDTIDIGGNNGALTIGKLPDGVSNSSLTWVPVKLYSSAVGGLQAPSFAPNEVYPLRWEVDIDAVFLDGKKLADTTQKGTLKGNSVSALIDTGNSIMRGPSDVVNSILSSVSPAYAANNNANPTYPCATPHTLAFQIGGKTFPIDPVDFVAQNTDGDVQTCAATNIVPTDAPGIGATFSWSFGDPFLKSNLVAFYYGNLTHPSVDPPRIGFMSTVPNNTTQELQKAVSDAKNDGGVFETTVELAPTEVAVTTADLAATGTVSTSAAATQAAAPVTSTPAPASTTSAKKSSATLTTTTSTPFSLITIALLSTLSFFIL